MCFSATASFSTAAILIPSGMYCIKAANQLDKPYWAFSLFPFMFGLQQLIEGGVWYALLNRDATSAHAFALGFLLFSHVFWLGWVPYSSYLAESSESLRSSFKLLSVIGVLFGLVMIIPVLLNPDWLIVSIVNDSIFYKITLITDVYIYQPILTIFYAILILVPLLLSSDHYHNILGFMILFSGILTWVFYNWAFISVWCYFSAIISLYIFFVIARCVNTIRISKPI